VSGSYVTPGKQDKTMICKFWLKKRCKLVDCRYAHGEEEKRLACKSIVCEFQKGGQCRLGAECLYAHSRLDIYSVPDANAISFEADEVSQQLDTIIDDAVKIGESEVVDDGARSEEADSHSRTRKVAVEAPLYRESWQSGKYDKTQLCTFWLKKKCARGADCKYAHGKDEQQRASKSIPCRLWQAGKCHAGESCQFAHSEIPQDVSSLVSLACTTLREVGDKPSLADFASCSPSPNFSACSPSPNFSAASMTPQLGPSEMMLPCSNLKERARDRSATASTACSATSPRAESEHSFEGSDLPPRLSDKTLLCKFWLKKRCEQGENCRFAHGEEEKRLACKSMMCQFQIGGSCRLGADCLYVHSENFLRPHLGSSASLPDEVVEELGANVQEADSVQEVDSIGVDIVEFKVVQRERKSLTAKGAPKRFCPEPTGYADNWQSGKFDKTQLCKFWLKGKCARSVGCKYAHGEDERRGACKAIQCREFQTTRSCHLGALCPYTHSKAEMPSSPELVSKNTSNRLDSASPDASADASPRHSSLAGLATGSRRAWADFEEDEEDFVL